MVKGFVLPEMFSLVPKNAVCVSSGYTLQAIHDAADGDGRRDQQVDMVGHDQEGVESVLAKDGLTSIYGSDDADGDTRIFEPEWT